MLQYIDFTKWRAKIAYIPVWAMIYDDLAWANHLKNKVDMVSPLHSSRRYAGYVNMYIKYMLKVLSRSQLNFGSHGQGRRRLLFLHGKVVKVGRSYRGCQSNASTRSERIVSLLESWRVDGWRGWSGGTDAKRGRQDRSNSDLPNWLPKACRAMNNNLVPHTV